MMETMTSDPNAATTVMGTTTGSTGTNTDTNRGIDLQEAWQILSRRSTSSSAHPPQHSALINESPSDMDITALQQNLNGIPSHIGCGCCSVANGGDDDPAGPGGVVGTFERPTGQVIDIGATALDDGSIENNADANVTPETNATMDDEAIAANTLDQPEQFNVTQQQAVARQAQFMSTIQSMTTKEIITAIFQTQEERVKCYRFFDEYVPTTSDISLVLFR